MDRLALAQTVAHRFNGNVEANPAAIFEAIDDSFLQDRRSVP
ncbi:hypothetical protein [Sphingobium subterraneum]|uniref:Uncharacterized protein n=1 Tax=Sphingobium subterraneum TaxID=627688 RepID=A0A841J3N2_9SPHN|nr:hypothetical protein [Sphingobium subterraneum]MBB6125394.1 hypothetical protein [Sphingobium subterraneum]